MNKNISLHTHVQSLYDADIPASALCARIKEIGGAGCAITDHGSLTAIESYRREFAANGLKLIPGVELYIDGGLRGRVHLIVLAKNDRGYYNGISKMVTASNKNMTDAFPVITKDEFFRLAENVKGDIIVTSACMQGVICSILLRNNRVQRKIDQLTAKRNKYMSPDDESLAKTTAAILATISDYDNLICLRDETKLLAEKKFTKREKDVQRLEATEDSTAASCSAALEEEKALSLAAVEKLEELKMKINDIRKQLSSMRKLHEDMTSSVAKYQAYEEQVVEMTRELQDKDCLYAEAKAEAKEFQTFFGKDFYMEIQYHGIADEATCFTQAVAIAKELQIPLVATNDVHILNGSEEERLKRQLLRSLRFGKDFEKENIGDETLYLKTDAELAAALSSILEETDIEDAINNISVIFDECNVSFATDKHYPKFSDKDSDALLEEEIQKGIANRFPEGMDEEHKARLAYELPIIQKMGYSDYHLIVKDFIEYGRLLGYVPKKQLCDAPITMEGLRQYIQDNNWRNPGYMIGTGRGSAAGSLVCYLIGITNIDPIPYGLLFERFLNPERISMPDIDTDMGAETREKVVAYVRKKYGNDAVSAILTTTRQAPKGSIKIAAKFYGFKQYGQNLIDLGTQITKLVPPEVGVSFATPVNSLGKVVKSDDETEPTVPLSQFLLTSFQENPDACEIIRWAMVMEGAVTAYGSHAAGIVISDNDDISDYLPLRNNAAGDMMTTQCDMVQVEECGLLKFDFLGLKTLDVITETVKMVEERTGIIINPLTLDVSDENVYRNIFSSGKTNAVFQFESTGMKAMLKRFKPSCFEDLIILVSMFRPGPLQYLDGVINIKNGTDKMTFLCPQLQPILGKTYGAIVYQEQVMEIFQKLAGYTFGGADMVRRYMSKKKKDKLAHEKDAFIFGDKERGITGCVDNGIDADTAEELFAQMSDFASYAFNKSHACAYAFNSFITAWLKYYYPAEFFAAALNWATPKKLPALMNEAKNMGVKILSPDVNISADDFCVVDGAIRFGLSTIRNVSGVAEVILKERNKNGRFVSLPDLLKRVDLSSDVIANLIDAGACDCFGKNRLAMQTMATETKEICSVLKKKRSILQSCNTLIPVISTLATDVDVKEYQRSHGCKTEITSVTTAQKLITRAQDLQNTIATLEVDLNAVAYRNCTENRIQRISKEHELLGAYVTEHPIDLYPTAEEMGVTPIADVSACDNEVVYGVITNLAIKQRKKDGANMAFFTLEDQTGQLEVAVFTSAYAKYERLIAEGLVVKLTGAVVEDGDGEDEVSLKLFANDVAFVKEKQVSLMMSVSSYATFHLDHERAFKDAYQKDDGCPFLIFDTAMNEVRVMKYCVSDAVRALPHVVEV